MVKFSVAMALCLGAVLGPAGSGVAADVSFFGVVKYTHYQQTVSTGPTVLASNAYAFTAFVVPSTNYSTTNASFLAPNVSTNRSLILSTNGAGLEYDELFQTSAALDTAYPSSTSFLTPSVYKFTFGTIHDGVRSGNASYAFGGTPPTPSVTNLTVAQSIDTTMDLTLRWAPMGSGLLPIVQLLVVDAASNVVYTSPAPFSSNALTSSSSSNTIPANSLPAGTNLIGHLVFALAGLPDTNSYSGAAGVAAIARDTAFPVITRPAPIQPTLHINAGSPPLVIQFTGETNRQYHLQGTTNLNPAAWVDLLVTNAPAASFADPQSVTLPWRYYRVQVGP
jgi:hypothetical protein